MTRQISQTPGWPEVTIGLAGIAIFGIGLALLVVRLPLNGASGSDLLRGIVGAAVMMLVLGRPYGIFLNFVRSWFGLEHGGARPMSLNV